MNLKRYGVTAAIVVAGALILTSCASNETPPSASAAALSGTLNGSGSTAQAVAQTTWIAGFQTANPGVTVNYAAVGSGAGVTAFQGGSAQYGGSDAALNADQRAGTFTECKAGTDALDLPVYISPIDVAFNLSGVTSLKLDAPTIAKIFSDKITKWNDPAIAALNSGATLPATTITPIHRSDSSGTTNNFTDYLNKADSTDWTNAANNVFPFKGEAGNGTSGVVAALKAANGGIAYVDNSAAAGLAVAQIQVGTSFVTPSAKGAAATASQSPVADGVPAHDLSLTINRTLTDPTTYPIVLVSYLIVCQNYASSADAKLVKAYATYVISAAGQATGAAAAGSAPLDSSLTKKDQTSIATIK
ncbi:MAG TPA: phosphate ABC transporter substrate-binding protein PstS [Galbitalea sp.]|nr:phosphate ABC transporter substrate-binding protein PstS [Galbitalea sp.]